MKKTSAAGEILMKGSSAFGLLGSSCWYAAGGKRFGVDNEEISEMSFRQGLKIISVGKIVLVASNG